jgi:hypothetical protein
MRGRSYDGGDMDSPAPENRPPVDLASAHPPPPDRHWAARIHRWDAFQALESGEQLRASHNGHAESAGGAAHLVLEVVSAGILEYGT